MVANEHRFYVEAKANLEKLNWDLANTCEDFLRGNKGPQR